MQMIYRPHQFSSLQSDTSVQSMAKNLQDALLFARIEGGYLIVLEAKCHHSCLATFRNHHGSHIREIHCSSEESLENKIMEAITLVELVIYIESSVEQGNFFLSYLNYDISMKVTRNIFGISKRINKVQFKEQLLWHF